MTFLLAMVSSFIFYPLLPTVAFKITFINFYDHIYPLNLLNLICLPHKWFVISLKNNLASTGEIITICFAILLLYPIEIGMAKREIQYVYAKNA